MSKHSNLSGAAVVTATLAVLAILTLAVPGRANQTGAIGLQTEPSPAPSAATPAETPQMPAPQTTARKVESDPKVVSDLLDSLIREALRRNPGLAAQHSAYDAAVAHIPIEGVPADPLLGFRLKDMPTTFSFTRENATEKQIEFDATYPFPGKLTVREDVARRQAEVVRAGVHRIQVDLIAQVRIAFAELFAADEDISVAFARRRILAELTAIASNKYRLGTGLQQDVLNADVALARIDTQLVELRRKRLTREIRLATLLDQDAIHVPPLGALPPATLTRTSEQLQELALAINPEVEAAVRTVSRQERSLDLARRAVLPDFNFGGYYGSRNDHPPPASANALSRPDFIGWQLMATVPIFYFSKQRQQVAEARAQLLRSQSNLAEVRRKTIDNLSDLIARYRQHDQVAKYFQREVIPLAHSAVAAAISAYQLDKVDFLTMLAAEDKLDDYQAEFYANEASRFSDLAQIDAITGDGVVARGPLP